MSEPFIHVPEELFAVAESSHFLGEFEFPQLVQGGTTFTFLEPLPYSLTVTNTGGAFLVSGSVSGRAQTECVRCLEPAYFDLVGEVEAYFLIAGVESELTQEELDEYEQLPESHDIALAPLLQAALALAVPYQPLCKEDCKGLCSHCGANLNVESCSCKVSDLADDELSAHPFAVLKNYDFGE